jgi:hypothetical protein
MAINVDSGREDDARDITNGYDSADASEAQSAAGSGARSDARSDAPAGPVPDNGPPVMPAVDSAAVTPSEDEVLGRRVGLRLTDRQRVLLGVSLACLGVALLLQRDRISDFAADVWPPGPTGLSGAAMAARMITVFVVVALVTWGPALAIAPVWQRRRLARRARKIERKQARLEGVSDRQLLLSRAKWVLPAAAAGIVAWTLMTSGDLTSATISAAPVFVVMIAAAASGLALAHRTGATYYCLSCSYPRPDERDGVNERCPECGSAWWTHSFRRPAPGMDALAGAIRGKPTPKRGAAALGWGVAMLGAAAFVSDGFGLADDVRRAAYSLRSTPALITITTAGDPGRNASADAFDILARRPLAPGQERELLSRLLDQRLREGKLAKPAHDLFAQRIRAGKLDADLMQRYFGEIYTNHRIDLEPSVTVPGAWRAHLTVDDVLDGRYWGSAYDIGVIAHGVSGDGGETFTTPRDTHAKFLHLGTTLSPFDRRERGLLRRFSESLFGFGELMRNVAVPFQPKPTSGWFYDPAPGDTGEVLLRFTLYAVERDIDFGAASFTAAGEPNVPADAVWTSTVDVRAPLPAAPAVPTSADAAEHSAIEPSAEPEP